MANRVPEAMTTAGATDLASDAELDVALSVLLNQANDEEHDWAIDNVCKEMARRHYAVHEVSHG